MKRNKSLVGLVLGTLAVAGLSSCSAVYQVISGVDTAGRAVSSVDRLGTGANELTDTVTSISSRFEASANKEKMLSLKAGQTKDEVLAFLGRPDKTELYPLSEETNAEILFYRTKKDTQSMMTKMLGAYEVEGDFTPVVFENDKLIGWGNKHYQDLYRKQSKPREFKISIHSSKDSALTKGCGGKDCEATVSMN